LKFLFESTGKTGEDCKENSGPVRNMGASRGSPLKSINNEIRFQAGAGPSSENRFETGTSSENRYGTAQQVPDENRYRTFTRKERKPEWRDVSLPDNNDESASLNENAGATFVRPRGETIFDDTDVMGVDQPASFLPHFDTDANPDGDDDSDADVVAEHNSPEPQVNFSLNLSSLDLSLSPTGKSTDVVQSVDERRISTGTYVTSPTFANLRDVASPRLKPVAEDVLEISGVEPFIDQSTVVQGDVDHAHVDQSYVSPADESHDEISILIQNQMRLSRGLKVEAVDRLDSGRVLDLADQSILMSKKGQGHQSFLQNATISDFG